MKMSSSGGFRPIVDAPKTSLIYNILKEYKQYHDGNGNWQVKPWPVILKSLQEKKLLNEEEISLFGRTITVLHSRQLLKHDNGFDYSLTDDGYFKVLEWEKDFLLINEEIPILNNNEGIRIDRKMKIFISCGERDNEYPIGDWLERILVQNVDVQVYWWHKYPTDPESHRPTTEQLFKKIDDCEFLISILHRRYKLPNGLYTTSTACEDELKYAYITGKARFGFRQKGVAQKGMIAPAIEIRAIERSDDIVKYLKKALQNYINKLKMEELKEGQG